MHKLLKPKDLLVLGLAGMLDVFEEVKDPFGVGASGAKSLYSWVPRRYKRHNFGRLAERSLRTRDIEKVVHDGEAYFRLTSVGRERAIREFPVFAFQNRKWDRKWRLVIFDIAELNRSSRDSLRRKLKELGLGMLQRSVWITPHDIGLDLSEFLKSKGLEAAVFVLEVSALVAGDKELLANKVWGINSLHKRYWELLVRIEDWKRLDVVIHDREHKGTDSESKKKRDAQEEAARAIKKEYLQILLCDPVLPKELLPKGWLGGLVRREIRKVKVAAH